MNRGKHENSKLLKELLRISWSEAAIIGIWTYIHEREICSVYGFSCDSYPDDCGVTYYTLTLFDTNGVEYDFHNID